MRIRHSEVFFNLLSEARLSHPVRFWFNGEETLVGLPADSSDAASAITVRVTTDRFFSRVLAQGNLGLAESFMDSEFEVEDGMLHDLLTILLKARVQDRLPNISTFAAIFTIRLVNLFRGRVENVRKHYDTGLDLFETFLDPTMTYSCGYAHCPEDSIEQMQRNKMERICEKLRLRDGDTLLDIGCGFGGLLIHAAKRNDINGVGITVSRDQWTEARKRVEQENLSHRIDIRLQDYRDVDGRYDKLVTVGMMEHVRRNEYSKFFQAIATCLKPGGLGLLHTIGCNSSRNVHDPFIQKYIFPGSAQPRLSEISGGLERTGLAILDVENMIRHYAPTAMAWLQNFKRNRLLLNDRYNTAFQRMWEYYLSCAIAAARASDSALYQVLFTNDVTIPLPLRRV